MFGRNGRDAERWRLTHAATAMNDVAIPGRSLMSMNVCFCVAPCKHGTCYRHSAHNSSFLKPNIAVTF